MAHLLKKLLSLRSWIEGWDAAFFLCLICSSFDVIVNDMGLETRVYFDRLPLTSNFKSVNLVKYDR